VKILIIEDDVSLALTIKNFFNKVHIVDVSHQGQQGIVMAESNDYDVIILDLMLPDMDGIAICSELRVNNISTPIIMLTVKDKIEDRVTGLNIGADDYLPKPFSFTELEARLKAIARRPRQMLKSKLKVGELVLDTNSNEVTFNGKKVVLRRKELAILELLMRNPNKVLTREMIWNYAWDSASEPFTNTVDVHIKQLRTKIDQAFDVSLIKTVHGFGYKIIAAS
jgi:DNA-binding response OmpR family regulator